MLQRPEYRYYSEAVRGRTTIYDNFNELRCLRQGSWDFEQYLAEVQLLVNCCQIQNTDDKELLTRHFLVTGANSEIAYRKCVEAGRDGSLETIINIYRNKTVAPQVCIETLNRFRKDTCNSSRRSNSRRVAVEDVTDNSSEEMSTSQKGFNGNTPVIQHNRAQAAVSTSSQQGYNDSGIQRNGAQTVMNTSSEQENNDNTQ